MNALMASSIRSPMRLADLAATVGIAKSSLLSICNALTDEGLIRKFDGGYTFGSGVAELASAYLGSIDEVDEFYAVCHNSVPDSADTIHLASFKSDMEITYLARIEGTATPALFPMGRTLPAGCSATGKALLVQLPHDELLRRVESMSSWPMLTERSLPNPEALLLELKTVRAQGHGVDDEEATPGLLCVGMTLPSSGQVPWAVGITMVKTEQSADRIAGAVESLTAVISEMALRLGR